MAAVHPILLEIGAADGDARIAQHQRRAADGPERVMVADRFAHDVGTASGKILSPRRGDDRGGKAGIAGHYPQITLGTQ
jgi:hypothetical protein